MRRLLIASFWLGMGLGTAAGAWAQAPAGEAPLARVYSCAEVRDDRDRLACYDAAVGRLRQAETQGEVAVVDRARAREVEQDSFGFHLPSLSRILPRFGGGEERRDGQPGEAAAAAQADGPLSELAVVVRAIQARADGRHLFTMENGQVWSQVEPQRTSNVRPGTRVTIRRAAFGSFMLVSERGGAGHRVRRVE